VNTFEPVITCAGIIVPSLLIVLAIRRWFERVPAWVVATLFAIVLLVIGRGVFSPDMPVALDEVARGYPYRGIFGPVVSKNPDTNDTVKQMLPWMQVAREELFARRFPLWNRYSFSGYPLLGNGQSAPFSPFFLMTLFVPLPKQIVAMAGLKLFVGLFFGYLVMRRENVSPFAALFGSSIFSLSIFQNVYLYYPLSAVTFLLPVVAYAALRTLDEGQWRSFVLLSIAVAAVGAAGHPESAAHVALAVAGLVAIEFWAPAQGKPIPLRRLMLVAAGGVAGLCLAAPALFPVVEEIVQSERVIAIAAGPSQHIRYPATALWAMVNPDGFGNPARGNWRWIMHYILVAPSYLGLVPLSLIPFALLPRGSRRDRLLVAFALLSFLAAMNWTWVGDLVNRVPPLSLAANDRLRFVTLFAVAILSARLIERLPRTASPFFVWPVLVFALSAYVFVNQFGITLSGLSAVGMVMLAIFWIAWMTTRSQASAVAFLATAIELIVFNAPFNAMTARKYYEPQLPIIDAIRRDQPQEPFRIVGADWVFLPNASAQYRLEDIRGSDPMAWGPYIEFFRRIQAPGQTLDVGRVIDVNHPVVTFLNVLYLLAEPGSDFGPQWRLLYRGPDGDLYRHEQPLSRFFAPQILVGFRSPATVDEFAKTIVVEGVRRGETRQNGHLGGMWLREVNPQRFRMAIDAIGPLLVASSEPAAQGWVVKVNHEVVPIVRVNGAFLGFWVPAGHSRVSIEYQPSSFRIGLLLALLTLVTLAVMGHRNRRNRVEEWGVVGGPRSK
jgi:hypothetical protein